MICVSNEPKSLMSANSAVIPDINAIKKHAYSYMNWIFMNKIRKTYKQTRKVYHVVQSKEYVLYEL